MERDVRHDLNNFLSAIVTYAELLMQGLNPESPEYKFSKAILESGMMAIDRINDPVSGHDRERPQAGNNEARSRKHLLVVDDQPDILATMQAVLEQGGYAVRTCGSADALQTILRAGANYDLVILDESMPDVHGHEIAAGLDRDYPGLPILIVTGHKKDDILSVTENIPCVRGIVEKTAMIAQLVGAVDKIVL